MLPDLHTDFSRGRSGGLVFLSLQNFPQLIVIHTVKGSIKQKQMFLWNSLAFSMIRAYISEKVGHVEKWDLYICNVILSALNNFNYSKYALNNINIMTENNTISILLNQISLYFLTYEKIQFHKIYSNTFSAILVYMIRWVST